jgi:hypothetical protein
MGQSKAGFSGTLLKISLRILSSASNVSLVFSIDHRTFQIGRLKGTVSLSGPSSVLDLVEQCLDLDFGFGRQ